MRMRAAPAAPCHVHCNNTRVWAPKNPSTLCCQNQSPPPTQMSQTVPHSRSLPPSSPSSNFWTLCIRVNASLHIGSTQPSLAITGQDQLLSQPFVKPMHHYLLGWYRDIRLLSYPCSIASLPKHKGCLKDVQQLKSPSWNWLNFKRIFPK